MKWQTGQSKFTEEMNYDNSYRITWNFGMDKSESSLKKVRKSIWDDIIRSEM
jgi:hypothetical protein